MEGQAGRCPPTLATHLLTPPRRRTLSTSDFRLQSLESSVFRLVLDSSSDSSMTRLTTRPRLVLDCLRLVLRLVLDSLSIPVSYGCFCVETGDSGQLRGAKGAQLTSRMRFRPPFGGLQQCGACRQRHIHVVSEAPRDNFERVPIGSCKSPLI